MKNKDEQPKLSPIIECRNISFCYPQETENAIENICFSIRESEFVVLCGSSGCGKTTLLRHLKKNQIPFGTGSGTIFFRGEDIEQMSDEENAVKIGYVGQNPETQIVTETVWHELAFGLENLGWENSRIRRRISETSACFGMESIFRLPVDELSGGQKQLLNLASVLAMNPELLILDEPTAMLDPIEARRFLDSLHRLNREFGMTIILSEQRLEEVLPLADRILVMHGGRLLGNERPENVLSVFSDYKKNTGQELPVFGALPTAMRVWSMTGSNRMASDGPENETAKKRKIPAEERVPVSIRQGKIWLKQQLNGSSDDRAEKLVLTKQPASEIVLKAKNLCFGYQRGRNILEDFTLQAEKGSIFAIMGGNGSGKTTALKTMMGILKPSSGSCRYQGKMLYLSQNPMSLFTEITVEEELEEMLTTVSGRYCKGENAETVREKTEKMLEFLELGAFKKKNPLDLSGGEKQRLALGKILMPDPDILLLDEPTKGLDAAFKQKLAELLRKLCRDGKTVVLVSHDLEFCGRYATHCGLLFDGCMMGTGPTREFFAENRYYMTAAGRMAQGILKNCVVAEDIVEKLSYKARNND